MVLAHLAKTPASGVIGRVNYCRHASSTYGMQEWCVRVWGAGFNNSCICKN